MEKSALFSLRRCRLWEAEGYAKSFFFFCQKFAASQAEYFLSEMKGQLSRCSVKTGQWDKARIMFRYCSGHMYIDIFITFSVFKSSLEHTDFQKELLKCEHK